MYMISIFIEVLYTPIINYREYILLNWKHKISNKLGFEMQFQLIQFTNSPVQLILAFARWYPFSKIFFCLWLKLWSGIFFYT